MSQLKLKTLKFKIFMFEPQTTKPIELRYKYYIKLKNKNIIAKVKSINPNWNIFPPFHHIVNQNLQTNSLPCLWHTQNLHHCFQLATAIISYALKFGLYFFVSFALIGNLLPSLVTNPLSSSPLGCNGLEPSSIVNHSSHEQLLNLYPTIVVAAILPQSLFKASISIQGKVKWITKCPTNLMLSLFYFFGPYCQYFSVL